MIQRCQASNFQGEARCFESSKEHREWSKRGPGRRHQLMIETGAQRRGHFEQIQFHRNHHPRRHRRHSCVYFISFRFIAEQESDKEEERI